MKVNWTLGVLLLVVLLAGLYVGHACGKPPSEFEVALDSLEVRLEQAVKDSARWSAVVDSVAGVANRSAQNADSARRMAQRIHLSLMRGRSPGSDREAPTQTPPATPSDSGPSAAFDSLAQAYVLMVRVDSLNQVTIGALTRRITADSIYIESLEAVRAAGQRVVATKPGRKLFGCRVGPSALIGLDGRVSAGAGVTCGL